MKGEFWRGRRVFITGHTGFKGAWLALWLQQKGARCAGYSLAPPTEPNLFTIARVASDMTSVEADILDRERLTAEMERFAPEVVFHLAAQSLVRDGYAEPVRTYATNVMGTVHLLAAAQRIPGLRAIVVVTSDKCYENHDVPLGYRESDPLGGSDPYSNSKACAELVVSAFRRSYFSDTHVGIATARAGNVIGGGDWARDRLLPDLVRARTAGRSAAIRNPAAVRPWQHVFEPLSGYLSLAQALWSTPERFSEAWNFGPPASDAMPVSWVADQVSKLWPGDTALWHRDDSEHPNESHALRLDAGKAAEGLHWHPQWSIARALSTTIDWYRSYDQGADMRACSLAQLQGFQIEQALPA